MKLSEIAKRLIIKSKSNLSRYILGNLSATEFRIAELQFIVGTVKDMLKRLMLLI